MKFREHRGNLADSMATAVEVASFDELLAHIRKLAEPWPTFPPVTAWTVHVARYSGIDSRTGWDTHIITLDAYGVLGFTDSACEGGKHG